MPDQNLVQEPMELERPAYNGRFIILMAVLTIVTLGLQLGMFLEMPQGISSIGQPPTSTGRISFGPKSAMTVMPGTSVIWQNELWVSVIAGTQMMTGGATAQAASSRLVAIDLTTGAIRETGITLSPSPFGLLVVDDQLWAVSKSVVNRIQDGQAIPRHPRRGLNQSTKPFAYEGRLAVIDKNKNDEYSLLTWNQGEWTEVAKVEVPDGIYASSWVTSELRILSDGKSLFVFFSDGQTIWYREGLVLISDTDPVSALKPENQMNLPPALTAPAPARGNRQLPGWLPLPMGVGWGFSWDVALINDELWSFCNSVNGASAIQQYKLKSGSWVYSMPTQPIYAMSFSIASSPQGYLVTNNLQVHTIEGSVKSQQTTANIQAAERAYRILWVVAIFVWNSTSMIVLVIGTCYLMRVHRMPQFVYGKREAIRASILRRGIARGIDTIATAFPPLFWFAIAVDNAPVSNWQFGVTSNQEFLVFNLFSVFGTWLAGIVGLSFTEGIWGITPGKWLVGIRTYRTTLRPCGILRSLARELLIYVDSLFLLTWLPGVLLIAFTKDWQRLGDLAADTVVVINPKQSWSSSFETRFDNG